MGLPVQPFIHPAQLGSHSLAHEWEPTCNDRLQWRGVLAMGSRKAY